MAGGEGGVPSPTKAFHHAAYPSIDPTRPELSTKGKNIVITGGAGTIGTAIAHAFAASGASNIAIIGRRVAPLLATKAAIEAAFPATRVEPLAADLVDADSTARALAAFTDTLPPANSRIDVLVANAGYLHRVTPMADVDPADWWQTFEVNVRGNFNLLRAFRPLAAKEGAVVIDIATAVAHIPYLPGHSGYAGAKLAAIKVFDYFRIENPGIRVVQFHPGVVATPMREKMIEGGVVLPVEDVNLGASFAVYAASPEAAYLDGKMVWAQWDVDELKALSKQPDWAYKFTIGLAGFGA